jgi:hypothetical protein
VDPIVLVFEDRWLSPPPTHVELCLSRAVYSSGGMSWTMRSWHRRFGAAAPDLSKVHAAPRELEMAKGISPAGELKVVSYEGLRVVREGAVVPPQRRARELAQGGRCRVDLP